MARRAFVARVQTQFSRFPYVLDARGALVSSLHAALCALQVRGDVLTAEWTFCGALMASSPIPLCVNISAPVSIQGS